MTADSFIDIFLIPFFGTILALLISFKSLRYFLQGIRKLRVNPRRWFDVLMWVLLLTFISFVSAFLFLLAIVHDNKWNDTKLFIGQFTFAGLIAGSCIGVIMVGYGEKES